MSEDEPTAAEREVNQLRSERDQIYQDNVDLSHELGYLRGFLAGVRRFALVCCGLVFFGCGLAYLRYRVDLYTFDRRHR